MTAFRVPLGKFSSYNNRKGQAKGFLGLKDRETQARGKKNLKLDLSEKTKPQRRITMANIVPKGNLTENARRKGDVDDTGGLMSVPEILHSPFEKDYNQHGKIGIYTPSERATTPFS